MRKESKDWFFMDNAALYLMTYEQINDTQAKISGAGKVFGDRVKVGDRIIIKHRKFNMAALKVEEIYFQNDFFEATVTANYYEGIHNGLKPVKIYAECEACGEDFEFDGEFLEEWPNLKCVCGSELIINDVEYGEK